MKIFDGLALLGDQAPYLRLPMLMISEIDEHGRSPHLTAQAQGTTPEHFHRGPQRSFDPKS